MQQVPCRDLAACCGVPSLRACFNTLSADWQTSFSQSMRPMPNVRIEDMGHKMGCNGVDNGKLWFDGAQPRASSAL